MWPHGHGDLPTAGIKVRGEGRLGGGPRGINLVRRTRRYRNDRTSNLQAGLRGRQPDRRKKPEKPPEKAGIPPSRAMAILWLPTACGEAGEDACRPGVRGAPGASGNTTCVWRVSEWLAATLEMWCPERGCGFESHALRCAPAELSRTSDAPPPAWHAPAEALPERWAGAELRESSGFLPSSPGARMPRLRHGMVMPGARGSGWVV